MPYYRDYCTASATAFICFLLKAHLAYFENLFLSVRVNESVDDHVSTPRAGLDRGVEKSQGNDQVIQEALVEKKDLFLLSEQEFIKSTSSFLLREWPSLMRLLHVEEPDIEEIKGDYQGIRRQCAQALGKWIKSLPRGIPNAATFMLKKQLKVLGISIPLIDHLQCDETNEEDLLREYEKSRRTSGGFSQALKATVAWNTYDFNCLNKLAEALELDEAAAGRAMVENKNDVVEQAAAIITIWVKRQSANVEINSVFKNLLRKESLESLLNPLSPRRSDESSGHKLLEDYLSAMCKQYKNVEFNFYGTEGAPKQLPLENVYVPLRLESSWQDSPNPCYYSGSQVPRDVEKASEMVFSNAAASSVSRIQHHYIVQRLLTKQIEPDMQKDQPATAVFKKYPVLVILGDPGSGKTTMAQWLTLRHAETLRHAKNIRTKEKVVIPESQADINRTIQANTEDNNNMGLCKCPIFIRAADFAKHLKEKQEEKQQIVYNEELEQFLGMPTNFNYKLSDGNFLFGQRLNSELRNCLVQGRAVVIVDGLDEIPTTTYEKWSEEHRRDLWELRRDVIRCVSDFVAQHVDCSKENSGTEESFSGNQIVITSRISGYWRAPVQFENVKIIHALVRPMERTAIRHFCHKWMRAAHGLESTELSISNYYTESEEKLDDSDLNESLKAKDVDISAERFFRQLTDRRHPQRYVMASNPLLLTILLLMYKSSSSDQLPSTRCVLYEKITQHLILEKWRRKDGLLSESERMVYWDVLCDVAGFILKHAFGDYIDRKNLKDIMKRHFKPANSHETIGRIDEMIQEFEIKPGILVQKSPDDFGFVHKSFLEFFGGLSELAWRESEKSPEIRIEAAVDLITEHYWQPKWKEPILHGLACAGGSSQAWPKSRLNELLSQLIDVIDHATEQMNSSAHRQFQIVYYIISAMTEWRLYFVEKEILQSLISSLFRYCMFAVLERSRVSPVINHIEKALRAIKDFSRDILIEKFEELLTKDCRKTRCLCAILLDRLQLLDDNFERKLRQSLSFDMEELGWPIHAILRLLASCDVGLGALPARIPNPNVVQEDIDMLEGFSLSAFKAEKKVLECLMKNETTLNDQLEKLKADFRHHWNEITNSLNLITKDSLASLSDATFRHALGGNRFAKDLVLKLRHGVMKRDLYESLKYLREMSTEGVDKTPDQTLLKALRNFAALFRGIIESNVTTLSQVKKQVVELSDLKQTYSKYVVDTFEDRVQPPTPKLSDVVRKNATYDVASVVAVFSLGSLLQLSSPMLGFSVLRGISISYCLVRSLVVEEGLKTLIQDEDTAAKLRFCNRYLDMEEGVAKAVVDHVSSLHPMMLKKYFVPALVDSCLIKNCYQLDKKERLLQREPLSLMSMPEIDKKVKEEVPKIKEDFDNICLQINEQCASFATCHFHAQTPRRVESGFADDETSANLQMIRRARQPRNSKFCQMVIALHGGTHYLGLKDFTGEYEHFQFLDRLSHTQRQQCLELHVLTESFPLFALRRRIAQTSGCSRVRAKKLAVLRQAKPVIRPDCIFTDRSGISDRLTKHKSDVEMEDMLESFKNELSTDATRLEESKALALCLTVAGSCKVVAKLLRSEVPMHRFRNEIADVLSERLHTLSDATCRAQIHFVQLPCVKRILQSSRGAQFCLEFVKLYTDLGGKPDTKLLSGLEDEGSPEDVQIVVRALILGFHLSKKEFRSDSDEESFQILPELRTPTDESKLRVCNILDCLSFCSTMDWWARRNTIVLPFFRRLTKPNICFAQEMKEAYSLDLLETLEAIAVCLPSFALAVIEFLRPHGASGICGLFWRTMHFVIQMRVNPRKEGLKAVEEKTKLRAQCQTFASSNTFASGQVLIALLKFFPSDVAEMQNKIFDFATTLSTSSSLKAFQLLWWCLSSPYSRCRETIADKAESYGSTIECPQKRALALCRLSIYCCSSQKTLELLNTSLKGITITELAQSTMAAELRQCVPELYFIISAVALKENGAVNLANRFWDSVHLGDNLIGFQSFALEQAKTLIELEAEKDDSIGILFNLILLTSRTRDTLLAGGCCLHLAGNEDKYWFAFQNGIGVTAQSARHKLRKRLRQGFLDLSVPVALVLKAMLKSERRMEVAEFFPHLRIVSKEVITLIEAWLEDDILCSIEIMENVTVKNAVLLLISECHGLTERSFDCIFKFLKCKNDVFRMRAEGVLTASQVYCTSSSSVHFLQKIANFVEDAQKSRNCRIAYLARKLLYSIHHDDASICTDLLKGVSRELEETVGTNESNVLIEGMYSASAEVWKELEKVLGELKSKTNSEDLQKSIFLSLCSLCHGFRLQGFNDTSKFYQHFSSCIRFFANNAMAEELLKEIQCFRSNPLAILRIISFRKEGDFKYNDVQKWLRVNLRDLLQTLSNDTIGAEYKFLDADLLCERSSAYHVLYCLSNAADDWRSERIRNIMENVVSLQWRDWELEMDSMELVESEIELDPSFSTCSIIQKLAMLCSDMLKKWNQNQTEFKNIIAGLLCNVVICLAGVLGAAISDKPSSKSFSNQDAKFLVMFALQRSPLVQYAVLVIIANLNFTELDDNVVSLTYHLLQYPGSCLTRCQILEKIRHLYRIVEEKKYALEKQLQSGSAIECVVACCLIAMMTKFSNMNSDILKTLTEKLKAVLQNQTICQQPIYPFWIDSKAGKFPLVEDLILETLTNISGSVFEAVPLLPYKLGEPDSKGVFVHEETSKSPIWYKYGYDSEEWLWTPYEPGKKKRVWMSASTDIVQEGDYKSYLPSLENQELIRYLQSCPRPPSSSGALGHLLT
ncbi:uncharacterized protein [Oscarella lobularis]